LTTTEAAVPARTAARSASPRDRAATSERVDRLNTASLRRIVEPDTEVAGSIGPGRVIPAELSIAAGLDLELTEEQLVRLSREELASIVIAGIRFEALLMSGFASEIAFAGELTDPRVTYMLHEIGEETRHSRLFVRLVDQLAPTARSPLRDGYGVAGQVADPEAKGHAVAHQPSSRSSRLRSINQQPTSAKTSPGSTIAPLRSQPSHAKAQPRRPSRTPSVGSQRPPRCSRTRRR
jgi:hypothetical protein